MSLPKTVGYILVLLAIFYTMEKQGYRQSLNGFFEDLMSTKESQLQSREKRASDLNSTEYVFQAIANISEKDLLRLSQLLNTLYYPVMISRNVEITSIDLTTVCSPSLSGYQCRCEPNFAWPYNSCITYGACDAIVNDTCGCIDSLPADDQYCQFNISQQVSVEIDLVLELQIPVSSSSSYLVAQLKYMLQNYYASPYTINQYLKVTELNITTECYPDSTGDLQCQCGQQFAWSCNKCKNYGACSSNTTQNCGCQNVLPYTGEFCEPITGVIICPAPTPVTVDIDLVLELQIPISSSSSYLVAQLKYILHNYYMFPINQYLKVTELNITTECYPDSTGDLQCQCGQQFAWSCNKCKNYGACSSNTTQNCGCQNVLPYTGEFCEPITGVITCPAPTPVTLDIELVIDLLFPVSNAPPEVFFSNLSNLLEKVSLPYSITQSLNVTGISITTECYPDSTGDLQCQCGQQFAWSCNKCKNYGACSSNTTQNCGCQNVLPYTGEFCEPITGVIICPAPTPVTLDIELVIDLLFPVSNAPPEVFFSNLSNLLEKVSLPYSITQSLNVTGISITTECYPDSTGDLQCQCGQQFAWSCNKCKNYGACSSNTTQNCGCQNVLPYTGEFCEPITDVIICPAPTPVDIDLVLELQIPISSSSSYLVAQLKYLLHNYYISPYTINKYLKVTELNITTECYPDSTGDLQCQCGQQFAWSCNKCKNYGACSSNTTQNCGCQNVLPYTGEFCEPITDVIICPAPTPDTVDINLVLELQIPISSSSSYLVAQLKYLLHNYYISPYTINKYLKVTELNITTECYPDSTGDLQCQCGQQFAWSCNKCKNYGACSSNTTQNCGCQNVLPYTGEFCEPITDVIICPAPTPVTVDIDLVLELQIPISSSSSYLVAQLKYILHNYYMFPINQYLKVTELNITTECYPDSTGDLQCQCGQQFAWSCNKCKNYGACSSNTTQNCGCQNVLPYTGEFCEPATNISICPIPPIPTPPPTTPPPTTPPPTTRPPTTPPPTTPPPTAPPPTTPPPTTPPPTTMTLQVKNASFKMDLEFNSAYNDLNSTIYQTINNAIKNQCKTHISTFISANLVTFRSGSTIADYSMTANTFQDNELQAVKSGIFTQLGGTYPMIFDTPDPLNFAPQTAFYGRTLTVTCSPPADISFGNKWTAEWRLNGNLIPTDSRYSYGNDNNGNSTLTISNVLSSDTGVYDCKMTRPDKSSFQQTSAFTVKAVPVIQVSPVNIEVECEPGKIIKMQCSVNNPYVVQFVNFPEAGISSAITHEYKIQSCDNSTQNNYICQVTNLTSDTKVQTEIQFKISNRGFTCHSGIYGDGNEGQTASAPCPSGQVGQAIAICIAKDWQIQSDGCVLKVIYDLLVQSQFITVTTLPAFLQQLRNVTSSFVTDVVGSPANVNATVQILNNVANTTTSQSITITSDSMRDVLITAGILTTAKTSWQSLNNLSQGNSSVSKSSVPQTRSVSSEFLQSLEFITRRLTNDSFDLTTDYIILSKSTFTNTFNATFNSSVDIAIPEAGGGKKSITVIEFSSMDNVLPARNKTNSTSNVINGRVVLVQSSGTINNVSFTFDVINNTLGNPQCVFWNFNLFNGLGGWDNEGCQAVIGRNKAVTCNCIHLTSFSILMSPYSHTNPVLDYITYIGVGISMASLVICLIIEAVIWRKINKNNTSYLRHVSIVNIAVSLLIADVWFIIGAAISAAESENKAACSTAAFFIHYFYLALFFWMFASALLLLYRTVSVFEGGLSKTSMLVIGFVLGYGVPFIMAIITIAVTAPKQQYLQGAKICWLNWYESKALLAFVIPALTIVLINLIILLVVIYKILRRRVVRETAHAAERNALLVIARTLAVLTPFFGITWGLGVGTMVDPENTGINIAFAFFNSLQGFFILVFGTLLDKKVRSELAIMSQTSSSGTRTTSAGTSSSGLVFFRNWRRGRDGYNVTSGASGASQS
ncbi:uncharacterized protein [Channa argus]|uniref:uncharacterized protein isoform X2 n=1 Tax=Channa argus TaxID=215402 RepID=UPI00351FCEEC